MAAQDGILKNGTNSDIVTKGLKIPKIIGSTSIAKIAPTSLFSTNHHILKSGWADMLIFCMI